MGGGSSAVDVVLRVGYCALPLFAQVLCKTKYPNNVPARAIKYIDISYNETF